MRFQYRSLPCAGISPSTVWSLHPWRAESSELSTLHSSLKRLGIVHPPLVMAEEDNTFTTISGQRRIQFAARYLKQKYVDCRVVNSDIDPHLLFDLILEDLPDAKALSLAEKARFLLLASKYFEKDSLAALFFSRLGIQRKQSFIDDLLGLSAQEDSFVLQVHSGLIEEQMLSELLRFRSDDRTALMELFSHLHLGAGKQKKTLNLLRDAACREEQTPGDYLKKTEITAILESTTLNVPQKIQHLDHYLRQQIYPESLEAENRFTAEIKALKLPENMKIFHSPAFEKDTVSLSVEFESLEQCRWFLDNTLDAGE